MSQVKETICAALKEMDSQRIVEEEVEDEREDMRMRMRMRMTRRRKKM